MATPSTEFYRLDPLTGCHNFLSFVETLNEIASQEVRQSFSILYADMNYMGRLNETKGHSFGDSVLRWLGIVLQEESHSATYRMGWDDFAVILTDGMQTEHEELLNQLFKRLNKEGEQMEIPTPPATIALIHFDDKNTFSINDVMFHLWETIYDVKRNIDRTINIYWARNLIKSTQKVDGQNIQTLHYSWEVLSYIANHAIGGIVGMGHALDTAQKNSFHDSISGLPNLRAALLKMEKAITDASTTHQPFSILLIDGDDFRHYNTISYATGDEVIRKKGVVLSENLRPGDFVARWRTGDEFIVILPNTPSEGARIVGERFRAAVKEASKEWALPSSITVGVATFPKHGLTVDQLVDKAESVLKKGKNEGKDRVVLAE